MNLGQKIKDLRENRGLKQQDLAEAIGITASMISMYESNKKKPGRENIIKLANALNVDPNYLMYEDVKTLTDKDRRDVAKTLDKIMGDLNDGTNAPLFYGDEMSETDRMLLKNALGNALEILKIKNKEKYTPKKYQK